MKTKNNAVKEVWLPITNEVYSVLFAAKNGEDGNELKLEISPECYSYEVKN